MLPDTNCEIRCRYSGETFLFRGFWASVRTAASILDWKFPGSARFADSGGAADWDGVGRWDGADDWDEAGCATTGPVPNMSAKSRRGRHQEGQGNGIPMACKA